MSAAVRRCSASRIVGTTIASTRGFVIARAPEGISIVLTGTFGNWSNLLCDFISKGLGSFPSVSAPGKSVLVSILTVTPPCAGLRRPLIQANIIVRQIGWQGRIVPNRNTHKNTELFNAGEPIRQVSQISVPDVRIAEGESGTMYPTTGNTTEYRDNMPGNDVMRRSGDETDIVCYVSVGIAC